MYKCISIYIYIYIIFVLYPRVPGREVSVANTTTNNNDNNNSNNKHNNSNNNDTSNNSNNRWPRVLGGSSLLTKQESAWATFPDACFADRGYKDGTCEAVAIHRYAWGSAVLVGFRRSRAE